MRFFLQENTLNGHNPAFNIKGGHSASRLGNFRVCCSFGIVGIWWLFPILKQCNALIWKIDIRLKVMAYLFIFAKMYV